MKTGGFIYAIGAAGESSVKIGKTAGSVATRLAALQVGYPARLQIHAAVRVEQGLDRIEKALHQVLETAHLQGEWFAVEMDQARLEALMAQASERLKAQPVTPFGERLQRLRLAKGLSRRQLAIQADIPQGIISRLERSEQDYPSVPVAMRVAKVLGVSVDYLIGMYEEDTDSELEPAVIA